MKNIAGKKILITGASRGLGKRLAQNLADAGASLFLVARDGVKLKELTDSLKNGEHLYCSADLSNKEDIYKFTDELISKWDTLDVVIHNAALETEGRFENLGDEDIKKTIDVNLTAPLIITKKLISIMKTGSHVVAISSIGGKRGVAFDTVYCATKAGIKEWINGMRMEYTDRGILFSAVFPGFITDIGMFARFNMKPPTLLGYCTSDQVIAAVKKVLIKRRKEVIVNSLPIRPLTAISELSPGIGDKILDWLKIKEFQRRKVDSSPLTTESP